MDQIHEDGKKERMEEDKRNLFLFFHSFLLRDLRESKTY